MSLITFGAQTYSRVQAHRALLRRDNLSQIECEMEAFPSLTIAICL